MKKNMKKIFKIVVSLTLLFIISCEKEEINNQNQKSFDLEKSKLTLQQVLKEINNEKKNDLILSSLNKDKNHLSNNFIARTSADSSNYIFNKYEKNNYVTYSLNLSKYTTETPYFLNLIITNNNLEALKIGYIKYIPENPISNIDLKTFSGEIQILNTDFEVKASSIFNNGIRQEDNQTNSQQRLICIDYIQIIEVTCSHGDGHGVGESCGPGYTNDAHYEIIQQTRCNELNDGPEPEFIIDINPIGNNGAGGGGSAVEASINLAINIFKSTLNQAQLAVYNSNKTDFDKYLKNNSISLPDALGAYTTNINTEAEQFVLKFIISSIESGLNIDFEKSLKSPANIDFSAIDKTTPEGQKLDCIYQKLMQSPSFKNLFSDIFGNNDRVNIKFGIKNSSELVDNQGNPVLGQTNTVSIQNDVINININLNQQFLLNQSPFNFGSNVYIAKVIAHECLHAYLQYIRVHDVNFPNITIPNLNNQTIAQLITSYIDQYHGGYEHNFIANELLPHLANVLNEIKNLTLSSSDISNLGDSTIDLPNAGINNEAFNWDDFFESLALQGLEKTNYFSNNYHTFNGNNPLSIIQYSNISNSGRYFFYNAKAKNTTTNCN